MSRLGSRSEIDKLAVTLALEPDQLGFLQAISPEELRSLRISIYERLFTQDAPVFERIAALAMRMPARAAATLAERAFGPLVTARIAAELPASESLAIARLVSVRFFADAAAYLDPRRTRDMIERFPVARLVAVVGVLLDRRDYMTMSRFIDFLTEEQVQAAIESIDDEAAILRIAFYMGSKNRMDHLFRILPRERLERLVRRVQEEGEELLPAFLSVLIHVSYGLKRDLADVVARQASGVLTGYIRATQEGDLWPDVLGVVARMSPGSRRRVVNLPILAEDEVQRAIVRSADEHGQWGIVLPLVREMGDTNRDAVAAIMAGLGRATLERAADGALLGEHWDVLLDLAGRMASQVQAELAMIIATMIGPYDPELLARIAATAAAHGVEIAQRTSESRSGASVSSAYS